MVVRRCCRKHPRLTTRMPNFDEILALDLLTLREHTELAGDVFDPATQREKLKQSLAVS